MKQSYIVVGQRLIYVNTHAGDPDMDQDATPFAVKFLAAFRSLRSFFYGNARSIQ